MLRSPFISALDGAVGCHRKEHVAPPDCAMLSELQALARGHIKFLTVAAGHVGVGVSSNRH